MESFDFKTSLQDAINQNPQEIIFLNKPQSSYVNLLFNSYLVKNPKNIPIEMSEDPTPKLDTCILYYKSDENELDGFPYEYTEHETNESIKFLEKIVGAKPSKNLMKVRCYRKSD